MIKSKRILVTGGAGSIGEELVRQLASHNFVFLFDQDETRTYDLYEELKQKGYKVDYQVGDIRNPTDVQDALLFSKPHIIFHAAALKHVSVCEKYPTEAYKTNVLGTNNILQLKGNAKLIFISTDKVVNEKCVMGKTKKMGETMTKKNGGIIVRFGNVMASRGSLFDIWERQSRNNEPITVTDKRMKRFFMSIPEAVFLILEAAQKGKPRETWIMKMGDPIRVIDVAERIVKSMRYKKGIKLIGVRKGEELEEQLMTSKEKEKSRETKDFYIF
jgi:FlaA1/EpsC-like NDP-sugar epimerase